MKKAYLVLNNGRVFEGTRIGAEGDGLGELVFTTGMTGYLETLTDPSYAGQIILQTFPLIGNYGVIPADFEGPCLAKGYVVRELCETPSNFRSEYALDRFLKEHRIPGICGVDTRALTRIIREEGVMNALICDEVPAISRPFRITRCWAVSKRQAPTSRTASPPREKRNTMSPCSTTAPSTTSSKALPSAAAA